MGKKRLPDPHHRGHPLPQPLHGRRDRPLRGDPPEKLPDLTFPTGNDRMVSKGTGVGPLELPAVNNPNIISTSTGGTS